MVEHDIAYELGWDHARHSVELPPEALTASHRLRLGYESGRHMFGLRARAATPAARQWLGLRLQALLRGRRFETLSVTPNYLRQLHTSHCPITRQALTPVAADACGLSAGGSPHDARVVRVRDDAAYAAGNLAMVSRAAEAALLGCADLDPSDITSDATGLDTDASARLAALISCVTPRTHAQAALTPLRALPPNRLRLLQPIHALQAVATRLRTPHPLRDARWSALQTLLRGSGRSAPPAWTDRLRELTEGLCAASAEPHRTRWALEDLWIDLPLRSLWTDWARAQTADRIEALLVDIAEQGLSGQRLLILPVEQTTDGWSLDTRGFSPPPPSARIHPFPGGGAPGPGLAARRRAA